jgi:DNA modification methylase
MTGAPAIRLIRGDSRKVLPTLAPGSADSLVTDPPAGISFMGKKWDSFGGRGNKNAQRDREAANQGPGAGLGNQPFAYSGSSIGNPRQRDNFIRFLASVLDEAYWVLKDGAYGLVWAMPRTSHWTALALEEANFEIIDRVTHLFGQGFPKGRGCLKPAAEDWWLVRKAGATEGPELPGLDACRVGTDAGWAYPNGRGGSDPCHAKRGQRNGIADVPCAATAGRWPANVVLSHLPECRLVGTKRVETGTAVQRNGGGQRAKGGLCYNSGHKGLVRPDAGYGGEDGMEVVEEWECAQGCPIRELDRQAGERGGGYGIVGSDAGGVMAAQGINKYHRSQRKDAGQVCGHGDSGGPSRFYYCPKASKADRGAGNTHPTVKPVNLMRWLCRLITPPGGTVLDPFCGSGSTAMACALEGLGCIGIEVNKAYLAIAQKRIDEL